MCRVPNRTRIDINPDDRTRRPDPFGRETRDDPRAARDVEHALPRSQRGNLKEIVPPRPEDHRHQVRFVILGRAACNLPMYLGAHGYLRS